MTDLPEHKNKSDSSTSQFSPLELLGEKPSPRANGRATQSTESDEHRSRVVEKAVVRLTQCFNYNDNDRGPGNDISVSDVFSGTAYKPAMEWIDEFAKTMIEKEKSTGIKVSQNEIRSKVLDAKKIYSNIWNRYTPLTPEQIKDREEFICMLREYRN